MNTLLPDKIWEQPQKERPKLINRIPLNCKHLPIADVRVVIEDNIVCIACNKILRKKNYTK